VQRAAEKADDADAKTDANGTASANADAAKKEEHVPKHATREIHEIHANHANHD
jgi:hypothetical protein